MLNRDEEVFVQRALQEDVGIRDFTTESLVPEEARFVVHMVSREEGVVAGLLLALRILQRLDPSIICHHHVSEGEQVVSGMKLLTVEGRARAILTGERVILNLVQRLSGVATKTRQVVEKVAAWDCKVLDTRKTMPGMRALERYAVRIGGGYNHRFDLGHAAIVKDNHWPFISDLREALQKIQRLAGPFLPVIVEVETLSQLDEALEAGVSYILLDNFSVGEVRTAVSRVKNRAFLEASGGITLDNVGDMASTGVQAVSLGCLTQAAVALDIGFDVPT